MVDTLQAINTAVLVICGAAIVSNLLAVVLFASTKQLRVKYYGFAFNLVLGDIAAPTFIFLHKVTVYFQVPVVQSLVRTSLCAAQLSILAIAVNRLLALTITPPARYDAMVTRGRMLAACLLIWVISAALYVPTTQIHTPLVTRLMRPLIALVILLITAVFYCAVFRQIARYTPPLASIEGVQVDDAVARTRLRQTRHLMITFTIILVTSFACWILYCVANFLIYFNGGTYSDQSLNLKIMSQIGVVLLVFNSVINPFIYWWRIQEFRDGMYRLICLGRGTANHETDVVTLHTIQEPEN